MGSQIHWVQSFVTSDKTYCACIVPNEEVFRKHSKQGEFPANSVSEVTTVIDSTTSE